MKKSEAGQSILGVYFVTAISFLKRGAACKEQLNSQQMATHVAEGKKGAWDREWVSAVH